MRVKAIQLADLDLVLSKEDAKFDEAAGLMRGEVAPVRYHTRFLPGTAIHPTYQSAAYAAAQLGTNDAGRHERARRIISLLLGMQEKDPDSPWCGVWPWYLEEPVANMAPPDLNWADFIAVQLLEILSQPDRLPDLRPPMCDALRRAAYAVRKRNIRLSYTNIAIMGTYVTIVAGQILEDELLLAYGRERLRQFVEFTRENKGFPEYNSPTYTLVSVTEVSRMLRDFSGPEDRALASWIHDTLWEEIATHWHAPSLQWAGPHSRTYATLLSHEKISYIQRALGERVKILERPDLPSAETVLVPIECPDRYVSYFADAKPRAHRTMVVSRGEPDLIGHTHLAPEFALSSAERSSFWNQSRGILAYAPSANGPVGMTVQFLHDGYDFCSAQIFTRQAESSVLAGIFLVFDGGDKHPELDRFPDGVSSAEDWRLRIDLPNVREIPGDLNVGKTWKLSFGNAATLQIRWLHAEFADNPPKVEISSTEQGSQIDLVFYHGERREFRLKENFPACLGLAMRIDAAPAPELAGAKAECLDGKLNLQWNGMSVSVPRFPTAEKEILEIARAQKSRSV